MPTTKTDIFHLQTSYAASCRHVLGGSSDLWRYHFMSVYSMGLRGNRKSVVANMQVVWTTRARASRAVEPGVDELLRDVRRTGGPPRAQSTAREFGRGFGTPSTWYWCCTSAKTSAKTSGSGPSPWVCWLYSIYNILLVYSITQPVRKAVASL